MHGPAPVGGSSPGHRGQGRRRHPTREPDPGLGDDPELLPPLFDKLSGMTGTAATEAAGVPGDIYKMDVSEIPTNKPIMRKDDDDEVYRTAGEKNASILKQIEDCYVPRPADPRRHRLHRKVRAAFGDAQRPRVRARRQETQVGLPHNVLNARYHEQEAADRRRRRGARRCHHRDQYGRTRHRHPARRQCRRCASPAGASDQSGDGQSSPPPRKPPAPIRPEMEAEISRPQGSRRWPPAVCTCSAPSGTRAAVSTTSFADAPAVRATPDHSKFFLSCDDDLLRIFAGDRLDGIMRTFGVQEGEAITHKWLNSAIATAQTPGGAAQLRNPQEPA